MLSLGGLSGTGRSLLGACTADRPVGCDARRRSCVGYALDLICCSRSLGSLSGTGRSLLGACTADRPMRRSPPRLRRLRIGYALDPSCCSRSLGSFHVSPARGRAAAPRFQACKLGSPAAQKNQPPTHPGGIQTSDRTTPPDRLNLRPNRRLSAPHTQGLRARPHKASSRG